MYGSIRTSEHKKVLLFMIGLLLLVTSDIANTISTQTRNEIMNAHNMYRRLFANGAYNVHVADMNKLEWSQDLEKRSKGQLQCGNLKTLFATSNIYMNIGLSSSRNVTNIIWAWFNEIRYFLPNFKTCQYSSNCMNFLTMITSDQRKVGCDKAICTVNNLAANVLMCHYEGGNQLSAPYKNGSPCTKCSEDIGFCDNGLCVACSNHGTQCDCKKTCTKHGVGFGRLNSTSCTCNCIYGMGRNCDEQCKNPEMYLDYDICDTITTENCLSEERSMLEEFCPEQCVCNKAPLT